MNSRPILHRFFARFMRAFFYLLYQPMAWSYDFVASMVSWGRWLDWVKTVLPYLKGTHILEIGHGPGHLQVALRSRNTNITGIDASRQMGFQAMRNLRKENFSAQLARSYAQRLPFPDITFDQIVATFPTEYIYAQETLSEVYRTLKPGGTLVVLPAAWITGRRLVDRSAAALFRVTGQSPDKDHPWAEPFMQAGFQTEVESVKSKSWSLIIILAQKPDSNQTYPHLQSN